MPALLYVRCGSGGRCSCTSVVVLRRVYFGFILLLEVLLLLAALPFLAEVCYGFVAGIWEAQLLVVQFLVAQHTASCPLAGVVGCLLPSCVQGLAEPSSRLWENGVFFWAAFGMNIRKECRNSGQRPSCSSVHFPSRGRARWVGGRRWPLSRRSQSSRKRTFYFPWVIFGVKTMLFFSRVWFLFGFYCWVC